jgi:hypothetical protein
VIARLAGVAVDARVATRTDDPVALAEASRWIAANALAIRGYRVVVEGKAPVRPSLIAARCGRGPAGHRNLGAFADLLAALAAVPALVDPAPLPVSWRLALRALGIPMLVAPEASTLIVSRDARAAWSVDVRGERNAYHVRLAEPRLLAA